MHFFFFPSNANLSWWLFSFKDQLGLGEKRKKKEMFSFICNGHRGQIYEIIRGYS